MFISLQLNGKRLVGTGHPWKQMLQIFPCQYLCFHPTSFNSTLHDWYKWMLTGDKEPFHVGFKGNPFLPHYFMVWTGSQTFIGREDKKPCRISMGTKMKEVSGNYLLSSTDIKWRTTHFVFLRLLPPQLLSGKEIIFFLLNHPNLYTKPLKLPFCVYISRVFLQR